MDTVQPTPSAVTQTATASTTPARARPMWFAPRWSKVLGDITSNRLRSLLVILAIAIGTFAVGTIAEARIRMLDGLNTAYRQISPFTGVIGVTRESAFDDDLVESVRRIPGVKDAEGRANATVRLKTGPNEYADLSLRTVFDWDDIRIGKFEIQEGRIPGKGEILLERSALQDDFPLAIGDELVIETLDQRTRTVRLVGITYDLSAPPSFLFGSYTGYMSDSTLEWLGESRDYTSIQYAVEEHLLDDPAAIASITAAIRNRIERSGRDIIISFIPPNPKQSPIATFLLDPLVFLLAALGVLMAFLSGFLVTTTISGLLTQQTRQIGVMKAIGARSRDVAGLYLWMVTLLGLIAFLVAFLPARFAAAQFAVFFGGFLNFDPAETGLQLPVIGVQLFLSLAVPVFAALLPIWQASQITVRQAIAGNEGMNSYGTGLIDRLLSLLKGLPRPLMISIRNTFRRKGRLALILTTLILAGAIFISVASVQASIQSSLNNLFDTLVRYDVSVTLERSYRVSRVQDVLASVPGVVAIENITAIQTRRIRPNDIESEAINFQGLRLAETRIRPRIVEGRWLLPEDQNALVVSANFLTNEKDVKVGDEIILSYKNREVPWRIVGAFQGLGNEQFAYANAEFFDREVREVGTTRELRVTLADTGNPEAQAEAARQIDQAFRERGIRVSDITTATTQRQLSERQFNIIALLLLIMSLLIALVGGLGLAGTMVINVMERTREIGVMRAIGASTLAIMGLVIVEGIIIGLMSWAIGAVLSVPISQALSNQVGILFTGAPLLYTFASRGVIQWLFGVLILASIASLLPAWNAARMTVRDVLAYE